MNEPNPSSNDPLDALFALARKHRPDTADAEYAFETRLLARLRNSRQAQSIWTLVSWRMVPFFAACLVALTIWHSQIVTDTDEAEQTAYLENPSDLSAWSNSDL